MTVIEALCFVFFLALEFFAIYFAFKWFGRGQKWINACWKRWYCRRFRIVTGRVLGRRYTGRDCSIRRVPKMTFEYRIHDELFTQEVTVGENVYFGYELDGEIDLFVSKRNYLKVVPVKTLIPE